MDEWLFLNRDIGDIRPQFIVACFIKYIKFCLKFVFLLKPLCLTKKTSREFNLLFSFYIPIDIDNISIATYKVFLLQSAKRSYLAFEKCHPGLSWNCIFFRRIHSSFFPQKLTSTNREAAILKIQVIKAAYDEFFDQ